MSRDDWYRNTEWSAEIEAAFRTRIARARSSRSQYLRIQAGYLSKTHPKVALGLIDQYMEIGDFFDKAMALCTRAEAYAALGKFDEAADAYKESLTWENDHPGYTAFAESDFPKLVAERRLTDDYDYALKLLRTRFRDPGDQFPKQTYLWNGSMALIKSEMGNKDEARKFARRALAAAEAKSPFPGHENVGLVHETSDDFGKRIKRIARPTLLQTLFRK